MKNENKEILLIDDRRENLELLSNFLLNKGYKIRSALDGNTALLSIKAKHPSLILLDIEMPKMDGFEVCKKLKSDPATETIPIIFISAHNDIEAKINAFKAGGVDYISKPFANEEVVARVKMQLELTDYQHNLESKVQMGLSEIKELNEELELTQNEMIISLGSIMETRDDDTGRHVTRVAHYSKLMAELYELDAKTIELIYKASPFHDAGKVAIPDSILNKPGKFETQEWKIMKTHALRGYEIFKHSTRPILKMAATIAYEHHECWDGSGYPRNLQKNEIHIAARIVIFADVLDALTNTRVYKEAWSFEESTEFIKKQKGKMFEPKIVDLFLAHQQKFIHIYKKLKD
jgi:putative two-component system response regulator